MSKNSQHKPKCRSCHCRPVSNPMKGLCKKCDGVGNDQDAQDRMLARTFPSPFRRELIPKPKGE